MDRRPRKHGEATTRFGGSHDRAIEQVGRPGHPGCQRFGAQIHQKTMSSAVRSEDRLRQRRDEAGESRA